MKILHQMPADVLEAYLEGYEDCHELIHSNLRDSHRCLLHLRGRVMLGYQRRREINLTADEKRTVYAIQHNQDAACACVAEVMRRAGGKPFLKYLLEIDWIELIRLLAPIVLAFLGSENRELYQQPLEIPSHSLDAPRQFDPSVPSITSDIPADCLPINPEDLTAEGQP